MSDAKRERARSGAAFLLSQLGGHSSRRWTARLVGIGLEDREVMLFRQVALAEGRTQGDVARAIGLPASRIVALVDRLEARGWIERRTSPGDRRTRSLHVTEAGRAVMRQIASVSVEHEAELTSGLDSKDRGRLIKILNRLAAAQGLSEGAPLGVSDPAAGPGVQATIPAADAVSQA